VFLGSVKRCFFVSAFDPIAVVRSLRQGSPQSIAEGDTQRPGRGPSTTAA
jgi:hypothetical protein